MPQEQDQFAQNVEDVLEALMFENWIRFYFIAEKDELDEQGEKRLVIAIPDKGMDRIGELYPRLESLALGVNGREANFETSRKAICEYVLHELDGKSMERGTAASIFDTQAFQVGAQLFNIWVQAYEQRLDERFLDFGSWRRLFSEWRASEQGRDIELKLGINAPTQTDCVQ